MSRARNSRAPPRQRVNHGLQVAAEVDAVTPAFKDAAVRPFEWVRKLSKRTVCQGLPVPERLFVGVSQWCQPPPAVLTSAVLLSGLTHQSGRRYMGTAADLVTP